MSISRTETIHGELISFAMDGSLHENVSDVHKTVSDYLLAAIDGERIKKNLRLLTKEPHLAGSDANKRVSHTIAKLWMEAGLEGWF